MVKRFFEKMFKSQPELFYWSSGRVNIIGEHSDYHDGYVMPAAIDLGITWAVSKSNSNEVRGYTEKFDDIGVFKIGQKERAEHEWMQYLQGTVEVMRRRGLKFDGVDFAIHSTIPIGSGLSSSSSLATGFAYILNDLYNLKLDGIELAKIGCEAEWWYGTTGGIMDQYCIANAEEGSAVLLDCRSLKHEHIKIPDNIEIVVFETTVRHKQKSSPFDLRKRQANEAIKIAQKAFPKKNIKKLRDLDVAILESIKPQLIEHFGLSEGEMIFKRSMHPVTENIRVLEMKDALQSDDKHRIGKILADCHESLKSNYEVSCFELDKAVELADFIDGNIGSRMIGGGFGGCTVNLIEKGKAESFAKELVKRFKEATRITGNAYICKPSSGLRKIES